jgi:hypothetical protein
MAELALTTADTLNVLNAIDGDYAQESGVANVALARADVVDLVPSSTGAGRLRKADASAAATAKAVGIALRAAAAGGGVTIATKALVAGFDLSALNFGADVFLSDVAGKLSTTPGTVPVVVGKVVPFHGQLIGSDPEKVLALVFSQVNAQVFTWNALLNEADY